MREPRILVTGSTGFVGGAILQRVRAAGLPARSLVRRPRVQDAPNPEEYVVSIWDDAQLGPILTGVDTVVHCASVVHRPGAPLSEYTSFNVAGTRALVAACRAQGVRRLVFLSSIKVYGEAPVGTIDENTPVAPESAYARSKLEAERLLQDVAQTGSLQCVILRLCPVFGVGDKGNVRTMIRAIARRRFAVPGAGANRKSLVHVETVADVALAACSSAVQGVFVVADRDVPSLAQLSDMIARVLDRPRPLRVPSSALYAAAAGCELGYALMRKEPRISRELIRKSLLPSVCNPAHVERDFGVDCHRDLYEAIREEVAWLRSLGEI